MFKFLWYLAVNIVNVHVYALLPSMLQKRFTERRVIRNIRMAYKTVPYYKEKYNKVGIDINTIRTLSDLKKLPPITKDEIREQFPHGIIRKGVSVDSCHYSATTGSTGRSLPFVFSIKTFAYYIATVVRVYTMIGYRPWHKAVYIKYTGINYPRIGPFFRTSHIPSTIPVNEQIAMLRSAAPDLLVGYASIVFEIAQRVTPEDLLVIRPKFIGVNSELSTREQRQFISKVFGCPVYDEYSTEETWMVASECPYHSYHLFTDNVWVEFLDSEGNDAAPGEPGEIYLTTTRSPVMPFIRYRIGDIGSYSDKQCGCGRGFPVLNSFDGRADDSFILPSGRFVSSLKILNTFTKFITKYLHLMEEFKVIQKEKGLVVIELVRGKEYSEARFSELINKLHEIFSEPVTIKVEFVESINTGGSIKRKAIESRVHGNAGPGKAADPGSKEPLVSLAV